jgi:hypothetical protein
MSQVLIVIALKFGSPITMLVLFVPDYFPFHRRFSRK